MEILWLAIVFYSVGLGLVLHFRPALMFNENGTWKEFGYQRSHESRYTIFPFWLFAVSWAFLSYALAATYSWIFPAMGAISAMTSEGSFGSYSQEEEEEAEAEAEAEAEEAEVAPVSRRGRGRPRKTPLENPVKPGYYVIDPATQTESGLRKYIYYGDKPPTN